MAHQSSTTSKQIIQTLNKYEPKSLHHEVDVVWKDAFGCTVTDIEGKEYIDFTSGIFVANIGHNHIKVFETIDRQLCFCIHSYVFPTEIRAELVKKLCEMTGFEKCYLCSTGSEAVEAGLRCMQAYAGNERLWMGGVWGLEGSFHGRTAGCVQYIDKWIHPLRGGEVQLPRFGFSGSSNVSKPIGLFIESYFGWNAQFHDKEWIQRLVKEAQDNGVPVCFDEIQSGFGRTGKLFAYEHYDVKPDLIVIGKGLGGGMPISAVLGSAELLDAPDDLTSTHTGNPVCCAAALASIQVLEEEKLVERAAEMGKWLEGVLPRNFPDHKIQGKGMVWALDIGDVALANQVVDKCAEKGLLLVKTHRGTIKIGPPLIIQQDALFEGLTILRDVINET